MLSACVCFGNTHRARRYGARACSSGGVHAIARDSLGTHEEENVGWGKDTAAPASACSYKEGEKREGGGVTLCPLRLLTALRQPFLHVGGEFYRADFCVTTSTVSSHNCAPFYLCVDSCVCHERSAGEKM